jgi:hypothetical protein
MGLYGGGSVLNSIVIFSLSVVVCISGFMMRLLQFDKLENFNLFDNLFINLP